MGPPIIRGEWLDYLEPLIVERNPDGTYGVLVCDTRRSYDEGEVYEVVFIPNQDERKEEWRDA